jgi:cytochrome c-type biogenesis protein CcmE
MDAGAVENLACGEGELSAPRARGRKAADLSRKLKFLIGASAIVLAVATLIYSAVRETSAYFITVDEYATAAAEHAGKPLRLAGRVSDGTVEWDPKTLDLEFVIVPIPPKEAANLAVEHAAATGGDAATRAPTSAATASGASLPVRYNGILPDMFADGRDVIVEGKVEGGVFRANTLLTTCPSKYEADQYETEADAGASPQDLRVASDAPTAPR